MRELLAGTRTAKAFVKLPILPPQVALLSDRGPYGEAIAKGQSRVGGPILNVSVSAISASATCRRPACPSSSRPAATKPRRTGSRASSPRTCGTRATASPLACSRSRRRRGACSTRAPIRQGRPCSLPTSPTIRAAVGAATRPPILKSFLDAGVADAAFAVHTDSPLVAEAHRRGVGARFTALLNRDETNPGSARLTAEAEVMQVSDGEIVGGAAPSAGGASASARRPGCGSRAGSMPSSSPSGTSASTPRCWSISASGCRRCAGSS